MDKLKLQDTSALKKKISGRRLLCHPIFAHPRAVSPEHTIRYLNEGTTSLVLPLMPTRLQ
jgi:hypothetical protein